VATRDLGKVLVIVPTYNERESLSIIVAGIRQAEPEVHILIADDNSPDGTGEVADRLSSNDSSIQVLHRSAKAGLGAAYLDAFGWAKSGGYDVVVEMDAFEQHSKDPCRLDQQIEMEVERVVVVVVADIDVDDVVVVCVLVQPLVYDYVFFLCLFLSHGLLWRLVSHRCCRQITK
jgi:glycosyltransferase involved in cell wall biosynthesis